MTDLKPTFTPTCGNCLFYIGQKDKHGTEGACVCNPPAVFPLMGRNLANQPTLQWITAPHPCVKEGDTCGHWHGNGEAKPADPKTLEN